MKYSQVHVPTSLLFPTEVKPGMRVAFHVEWKTVWVAASGQCSAARMQGSVSSWLFSPATKMCLREGHRRADSHESVLTGSCEERRLFLEKLLHGMTKVLNVVSIAPKKGDSMAVREVKFSANPSHFVNSLCHFNMVNKTWKKILSDWILLT